MISARLRIYSAEEHAASCLTCIAFPECLRGGNTCLFLGVSVFAFMFLLIPHEFFTGCAVATYFGTLDSFMFCFVFLSAVWNEFSCHVVSICISQMPEGAHDEYKPGEVSRASLLGSNLEANVGPWDVLSTGNGCRPGFGAGPHVSLASVG